MAERARRRALLVLGMHRSGTSCVARVVNLLGRGMAAHLRPPRDDNPTGFWEPRELSELNDRILSVLGTAWHEPLPLPEGWMQRPELEQPTRALRRLLAVELERSPDVVLKDPRLCLLFPLWRELLAELDCEVQSLLVVRDARAVAASLSRRDGLPDWQSELLWLQSVLSAELATRGEPRALVHYEELVRDWRSALADASQRLALPLPSDGTEAARAISSFVSRDLDHAPMPDAPPGKDGSAWIAEAMRELARPGALEDAETRGQLDRLRSELVAANVYLAPLRAMAREQAAQRARETAAMREREHDLELERDALADRLQEAEAGRATADRRLAVLRGVLEQSADLREQLSDRVELVVERFTSRTAEIETDLTQRLEAARDADVERARQLELVGEHDLRLRELTARLAALEAEGERSRAEEARAARTALEAALESAESARREAEARAARLDERAASAESELDGTRRELEAHAEALQNLLGSRSLEADPPAAGLEAAGRRGGGREAAVLEGPMAWEELLPGRPFRQRFQPPVSELAGLGVGFFTYGRRNRSRVRIRLFDEGGMMRSRRLLAETTLEGEEIQDGAASVFRLPRPIEAASSRSLSIEIESLDGRPGESVSPAVGGRLYEGRILSANRSLPRAKRNGLLVLDFLTRSAIARKSFAFVSGCPGDAHRYRCEHQAEMLRLQGYAVDVFPADVMPFSRLLESYQVVVCHRVPHTREFEAFVEAARERKVRVVFDTDDLVFAPEVEHQIAALDDLSPSERDLWLDGVRRYRRSLLLCDAIVVSTPGLQESIRRRFEVEPFLSRNRASDEMVQAAERARKSRQHSGRALRLAYLSGTATHERDFAQCVPALRAVMERHPTVHLVLAGHIRVPTELLDFEDRVDRVPFMPWQQLPELYATIDVNLAPLEPDNEFTEGKSELKYFEAALVGVPTLASPVGGFRDAIRHGQNGFLCGTREEWTTALEQIVAQPSLRERIGRTAMEDAYRRYTSRGGASETVAMWLDLLGAHPEPGAKLSIAWVLRAPIANTGGGYKKVFHLVEHLASRGHEVTVYVEPIAHLEGLSEPEIEAFCRTHFECGAATIRVGHESIADCDVAIATNWPTAYVVDRLANARLRAYLVQDDEGEFYGREDPLRREAAATYDLPLLIVGMGRYLAELFGGRNRLSYPHVDFALDDAFFEARDAVEQKLAGLATTKTPSLLFFARPGIPRRAFELGVEALTRFHEARPDVEIRLYGLDEPRDLPFPYVDLGIVDQSTTAAEMRRASVHLSFSRTNASTVMFEAMASGAVAVELDAPGVRSLLDDPSTCLLCDDSPSAVARALEELFGDGRRMERIARAGLASASRLSVESMCRQFEEILVHHALGTRDD